MRKLLVILLLTTPFIGFGQACQYGSSTDASEICDYLRGNNFATYRNADIALDKILDVTGMSKRFVLKECSNISNCVATTYNGIRYILYDRDFMDAIATRTNSWSSTSILAHEIAHHVNGHTLGEEETTLSESRQMEIEADEYSGFVMFKLGASLSQAQEAIRVYGSDKDDSYSTHPARDKRLRAIAKGYNKAKSQGSNNDYSNTTLTAENYFYKAYNNESDWQYQIDNYTKCLRIDPDYASAYLYRGAAYQMLGNYNDALADYSRAIRIDPDDAAAYYNRGIIYMYFKRNYEDAIADFTRFIRLETETSLIVGAYGIRGIAYVELGNFEDALADYSRAIRIDPDDAAAYNNRGAAYQKLGNYNDALADYSRAIRIDPDDASAYSSRALVYSDMKNYEDAIADYTRAIRIDPDNLFSYLFRGLRYFKMKNYEDAIADYTRVIRLDPDFDFGFAYELRAKAKKEVGLPYCSDYKRACDLGSENFCELYDKQCR